MNLIQRILCPTDFSPTADKAFAYANRLAESICAELILLHVFDQPNFQTTHPEEHPLDPSIEQQLKAIEPLGPDVKLRRLLHCGAPGEVICWAAQEHQCDVIVLGTHGHTGLMHLLLGSVAEYCLRHARCPVLTVRDRPKDEPPLTEPALPIPHLAPRWM